MYYNVREYSGIQALRDVIFAGYLCVYMQEKTHLYYIS